MAGKGMGKARMVLFLFVLFLIVRPGVKALADDAELLKIIPGLWIGSDEVQEEGGELQTADLVFMTFEEDGKVSLRCNRKNGEYAYTCEGTWSFELVTGGMDRIRLLFTSTDDPLQAGSEYSAEYVYHVYAESWVEDNTEHTYLLLEDLGDGAVTPFVDIFGYDGAALHRERGPNMRVVNCSKYVSLREKRSKTSARLAKVPLGALVLAFPEAGEENGFIWCVYHNEYGYILSEYLEPVE